MAQEQAPSHVIDLVDFDWVKHVEGSSQERRPNCDGRSWRKYWMKKTGENFQVWCQMRGCPKRAEVGAHVEVRTQFWRVLEGQYIIACCEPCNQKKDLSEKWNRVCDGKAVRAPHSDQWCLVTAHQLDPLNNKYLDLYRFYISSKLCLLFKSYVYCTDLWMK